jgi:pseudouridine-5'-phosphate glycosidase
VDNNHPFGVATEVADALAENRPVVALESTLISHGLPSPRNLETATAAEAALRGVGAVPATVAIIDGTIQVGLTTSELERLASADEVAKVSLRDVSRVLAKVGTGTTTVATTMFAAHRVGIGVFATGGIGGVHRGGHGDISADLTALATIPVAVVCAGAKAILDLPRTVETLETLGVPTVGYKTDAFCEFWSPGNDLPVSVRVDDPAGAAAILKAHWSAGFSSGVLITVPVPVADAVDRAVVERAVSNGLVAATEAGVRGNALTPFLLDHVAGSTEGATLEANIALIVNNARVAGQVAGALIQSGWAS